MRALAAVCLVAAARAAAAEPELGQSSRGRNAWTSSVDVAPVIVLDRRGHPFEYDWTAEVEGVPIDHDRFYELVGRPDIARKAKLRRALGCAVIAAGLATGALGVRAFVRDHATYGVPLYFGGFGVALTGAYFAVEPDPTSASEAQQLASERRVLVGVGANF